MGIQAGLYKLKRKQTNVLKAETGAAGWLPKLIVFVYGRRSSCYRTLPARFVNINLENDKERKQTIDRRGLASNTCTTHCVREIYT